MGRQTAFSWEIQAGRENDQVYRIPGRQQEERVSIFD